MILPSPPAESQVVEAPPAAHPVAPRGKSPKPMLVEWIALGAIVLALVSLALVRCDLTDTPYHLATARLALETGSWPTTNTFSYTHADYPLYQQYPVYQTILYGVYLLAGWEGLSVLHLLGWLGLWTLWIAWGGGWRWAAVGSLATMILVLGLRERMVLRPDLLTMAYFLGHLLVADAYLRGRAWTAYLLPAIMLAWVNSHQMFWIGLALQAALIVHVVVVRYLSPKPVAATEPTTDESARTLLPKNKAEPDAAEAKQLPAWRRWIPGDLGISPASRSAPFRPIFLAMAMSLAACFLSPIGTRVLEVPGHTFGSLYFHRQNVQEFAPFYTSPQATWLVAVSLFSSATCLFLSRRRIEPFEWFVWLLGLAMVAGAIRGAAFFVAISVAILFRTLHRLYQEHLEADPSSAGRPPLVLPRLAAVMIAMALCSQVYYFRWVSPATAMGGSQFGWGRTQGAWPDDAMAFLKRCPPPGRMINLSWYIGNPLIWDLFPQYKVFVDPRFEAYPRTFLVDALAAESDADLLDELLDAHDPDWLVGEMRVTGVRHQMARLFAEGDWEFVLIDPIVSVLVRRSPGTEEYLKEHRIDPVNVTLRRDGRTPSGLRALEELRIAALLADLGRGEVAERWIQSALVKAVGDASVSRTIDEILAEHPELRSATNR